MDDFEFGEIKGIEGSLEQIEDATYRKTKDFFGREKISYPYSSAEDFKSLTPEKIVTRRIEIIKPDIDAGQSAKRFLSEPQRAALQRLMAIKKNVEVFPKEKQAKMRADILYQYEQNKDKTEMLIDQLILEIKVEDLNKQLSKDEDKRLQDRLEQLRGVIPSEEDLIERIKKLKKGLSPPSEAELRERLRLLKKKGGSKKTRRNKKSKKSTKSKKVRKSKKSRKYMKPLKSRKSRRLVKH